MQGVKPIKDEVEETPVKETVEKTTEKLVERNMLGRLAKQLNLTKKVNRKCLTTSRKGNLINDTRPT
jgi:hypothetical protein